MFKLDGGLMEIHFCVFKNFLNKKFGNKNLFNMFLLP